MLWLRVFCIRRSEGDASPDASLYATFCILGKFAEFVGVIRFVWRRFVLRRPLVNRWKYALIRFKACHRERVPVSPITYGIFVFFQYLAVASS